MNNAKRMSKIKEGYEGDWEFMTLHLVDDEGMNLQIRPYGKQHDFYGDAVVSVVEEDKWRTFYYRLTKEEAKLMVEYLNEHFIKDVVDGKR